MASEMVCSACLEPAPPCLHCGSLVVCQKLAAARADGERERMERAAKLAFEVADDHGGRTIAEMIRASAREIHNESIHKKGTL